MTASDETPRSAPPRSSNARTQVALFLAPIVAVGIGLLVRGKESPRAPTSAAPVPAGPNATVIVYDDGRPAAGRRVVFHAKDGSVLHTIETGADGKARGPVAEDALITVAYGISARHLVSVMGALPNEEIIVGEPEDEGGVANVVCTANVFVPALPPNATKRTVTLGVGTTEPPEVGKPLPMQVLTRFVDDKARFRVLAEALDERGTPVAYAHGWGEGCSRDAGAVDVRLVEWKTSEHPLLLAFDNTGENAVVRTEASILKGEDDRFLRRQVEVRPRDVKEARFAFPLPLFEGGATSLAYKIEVYPRSPYDWTGGPLERTTLAARLSPEETPESRIAVDLEARMLPRVSAPSLETTAEPARPFVAFRIPSREGPNAPPVVADAVIVRATWPRTKEHVWTIVLPPNGPRRLRLPSLPDALSEWRPTSKDTTVAVALVDATAYESYADVRKKGLLPLSELDEGATLRTAVVGEIDF